jgi:hypothetical protein
LRQDGIDEAEAQSQETKTPAELEWHVTHTPSIIDYNKLLVRKIPMGGDTAENLATLPRRVESLNSTCGVNLCLRPAARGGVYPASLKKQIPSNVELFSIDGNTQAKSANSGKMVVLQKTDVSYQ